MLAAELSVLFIRQVIDVFKQYNGISMKNKTKEEAYLEMLKPAETITFKVQNCVEDLSAIKESCGDGFYIRYIKFSSNNPIRLQLFDFTYINANQFPL